jgi:ABC-2 type transport system permease protein
MSVSALPNRPLPEPGVRRIHLFNGLGLWTLYLKEVRRFLKVKTQTVTAPAVTTLLFLAIFTLALGPAKPNVLGVPYADFLAPGLIIMAMVQNAFANTSSSILIGKVNGVIVDVLMPPLSAGELVLAYVAGGVTRAFMVGIVVWLALLVWPGVHVGVHNIGWVLLFGLLGSMLLSLLGVFTGIWSEKFDNAAAITNFVIQPLTLLSGTFYSIERLPGIFYTISHANPFFFMIDGFRAGFLGASDSNLWVGAGLLLALNVILWALSYSLLKRGWRLKA